MIVACGALGGCGLASTTEGLQSEDGARVWTTCDASAADGVLALGATGELCTFTGGCGRRSIDGTEQQDDALCWEGVLYTGHFASGAATTECTAPALDADRSCVRYTATGSLLADSAACTPGGLGMFEVERCVASEDTSTLDASVEPWSFETRELCVALDGATDADAPEVQLGDPCTGDELCHARFWGSGTEQDSALSMWTWCRDGRVEMVTDPTR